MFGNRGHHQRRNLEEILDEGFNSLYTRIRGMEQSLEVRDQNLLNAFHHNRDLLKDIHEHIVQMENNVARDLSRINAALDKQGLAIEGHNTALADLKQTVTDEFAEVKDALQEIRDAEGDQAEIDTAADKIEASLAKVEQGTAAVSELKASVEGIVDLTVTINPSSVAVASGGTVKFKTNVPCNFTATSGSVGADGSYTAPSDGTATDSVTATSKSDPSKSAAATVEVNPPAEPSPL